jgi:hypothetical protein
MMVDQPTHYLRNASRRPVEIHLPDRLAVLLPREQLELGQAAVADPAVKPLLASGALTLHRLPEPEPPPAPPKKRSLVAKILKPRRKARKAEPSDPAPSSGPAEASGEPK